MLHRIIAFAVVTALTSANPRILKNFPEAKFDAIESYVVTPLGPVQGVVLPNARVFMSLPYAMPPVNELRWQPPQPAASWGPTVWQGIYDPPGCMQVCDASAQPPHVCPGYISENCLYLNVWTPRIANMKQPLPVTVFIHGGAFKDGYAGGIEYGIVYDGSQWVNTTTSIVVSINYRLGAMGFLYQGGSTSIVGNYGLMDQEVAFQWVKDNIAAFGGDPNRVTIIGQSAGGMSVASHLARPSTAGLYESAVVHSDPFSLPFRTPETGKDLSNAVAKFANCSDGSANANWTAVEQCLRGLNGTQVVAAQELAMKSIAANWERILDIFVPWTPTYNTSYLAVHPLAAFQAGQVVDVPIMLGTVANESNLFINFAFNKSISETEYYAALGVILGLDIALKIPSYYPTPNPMPADFRVQLSTVGSDALFVCPTRNAVASLVSNPARKSPVFLYWYEHVESFNQQVWGTAYPFDQCWPIVCHASELIELFHPNYPQFGTNYTAAETLLSTQMQWYWTNLAATGSPGAGYSGAPLDWPAYNTTYRPVMRFGLPNSISQDMHGDLCSFWDTVGYNFY